MKKNKNLLYNNQILNCLLNEKTYTTLEIASKVGLSEKTIRVRLDGTKRIWENPKKTGIRNMAGVQRRGKKEA